MKKISMNQSENLSVKEGCKVFLNHCKARNYSPYTIQYYENIVHNFSLFYDLQNNLDSVSKDTLNGYCVYLEEKGLSDATILTYIRGLKTIFYYLMEENRMLPFKIQLPKVEEKLKETYTEAELTALLKKPDLKTCSFAEYRDWVLVNYLLGTGQRLNTVIHLRLADLDLPNHMIRLRVTKGRRETLLPISTTLAGVLKEYLQYRKGEEMDYLFCTVTGSQMTRGCITSTIKHYNAARGVKRSSIHLFRHTFAKNYLMNGGDVFRLQKLMCHKEIETTKGYLNLTTDDLGQDYDVLNPLDTMQKKQKVIHMRRD